jgi:hypothetical protein
LRRRDLEYVQSGVAKIDSMSGIEFENYVSAVVSAVQQVDGNGRIARLRFNSLMDRIAVVDSSVLGIQPHSVRARRETRAEDRRRSFQGGAFAQPR